MRGSTGRPAEALLVFFHVGAHRACTGRLGQVRHMSRGRIVDGRERPNYGKEVKNEWEESTEEITCGVEDTWGIDGEIGRTGQAACHRPFLYAEEIRSLQVHSWLRSEGLGLNRGNCHCRHLLDASTKRNAFLADLVCGACRGACPLGTAALHRLRRLATCPLFRGRYRTGCGFAATGDKRRGRQRIPEHTKGYYKVNPAITSHVRHPIPIS